MGPVGIIRTSKGVLMGCTGGLMGPAKGRSNGTSKGVLMGGARGGGEQDQQRGCVNGTSKGVLLGCTGGGVTGPARGLLRPVGLGGAGGVAASPHSPQRPPPWARRPHARGLSPGPWLWRGRTWSPEVSERASTTAAGTPPVARSPRTAAARAQRDGYNRGTALTARAAQHGSLRRSRRAER